MPSAPRHTSLALPTVGWWLLFFLVCFGLGYPTLNRYDPASNLAGAEFDAAEYYQLVVGRVSDTDLPFRWRVLVPTLARPIFNVSTGRVGTWNPVWFSMLVINAGFVAGTACLLMRLAEGAGVPGAASLIGTLLYLLNFFIVNSQLAGYVDSAQSFFLLAMCRAMQRRLWWALPMITGVGAFARETVPVLAVAIAVTWWAADPPRGRSTVVWILIAVASGGSVLIVLAVTLAGLSNSIWEIPTAVPLLGAARELFQRLGAGLVQRNWVLGFIWVLPLAALGVERLPRPWVLASVAATVLIFVVGAYAGIESNNVPRLAFSVVGPLASLAAGLTLVRFTTRSKM
jgi:hypothetical protein